MMQAGSGCTVHCAGRERERKVGHQVPEAAPAVGAHEQTRRGPLANRAARGAPEPLLPVSSLLNATQH